MKDRQDTQYPRGFLKSPNLSEYTPKSSTLTLQELFPLWLMDRGIALETWQENNTNRLTYKGINKHARTLDKQGKGLGYRFKRYIVDLVNTFGHSQIILDRDVRLQGYEHSRVWINDKQQEIPLTPKHAKHPRLYRELDRQLTYLDSDISLYRVPGFKVKKSTMWIFE